MEELYFVSCVPGEEETPLMEGGETIRVTERNKAEYVTRLAEHFLLGRCRNGLAMMVAGFHDVIPKSVLRGTGNEGNDTNEGNGGSSSSNSRSHGGEASLSSTAIRGIDLELIVTGLPSVSVDDWKAHTRWAPVGKAEAHEQLRRWFWEVRCTLTVKCQVILAFKRFITTRGGVPIVHSLAPRANLSTDTRVM